MGSLPEQIQDGDAGDFVEYVIFYVIAEVFSEIPSSGWLAMIWQGLYSKLTPSKPGALKELDRKHIASGLKFTLQC